LSSASARCSGGSGPDAHAPAVRAPDKNAPGPPACGPARAEHLAALAALPNPRLATDRAAFPVRSSLEWSLQLAKAGSWPGRPWGRNVGPADVPPSSSPCRHRDHEGPLRLRADGQYLGSRRRRRDSGAARTGLPTRRVAVRCRPTRCRRPSGGCSRCHCDRRPAVLAEPRARADDLAAGLALDLQAGAAPSAEGGFLPVLVPARGASQGAVPPP